MKSAVYHSHRKHFSCYASVNTITCVLYICYCDFLQTERSERMPELVWLFKVLQAGLCLENSESGKMNRIPISFLQRVKTHLQTEGRPHFPFHKPVSAPIYLIQWVNMWTVTKSTFNNEPERQENSCLTTVHVEDGCGVTEQILHGNNERHMQIYIHGWIKSWMRSTPKMQLATSNHPSQRREEGGVKWTDQESESR